MPPLCPKCLHPTCICPTKQGKQPAPGSADLDPLASASPRAEGMFVGPDDAIFHRRPNPDAAPQPRPPGARFDPPGPFGVEPQPDALRPPPFDPENPQAEDP